MLIDFLILGEVKQNAALLTKESSPKTKEDSLEYMFGFNYRFNPGTKSFHAHRSASPNNVVIDPEDNSATGSVSKSLYTQEGIEYNGQTYYYQLTSEAPGNVSDFDYFLLTCPGIETRSRWTNMNLSSRSVLAKIPANRFLTTQTQVVDAPQHYVSISNFNTLTLQLIYPDGSPVNILSSGRFSMQLGVWYSDDGSGQ